MNLYTCTIGKRLGAPTLNWKNYILDLPLCWDMIFISQVMCFLSPSLGKGIKIYGYDDKNHIQPQTNEILFITL